MQFSTRPNLPQPKSRPGWFCRFRVLSWILGSFAALLLLLALFYAEENWRGRRTWIAYQRQLTAKGVDFNWHALAPPPVADADNFAATPFLAALFDFVPGTHTPRDMAAYNRTAGFAQTGEPYLEQRRPDPLPAMFARRRTDLDAGLDSFRKPKPRPASSGAAKPEENARDRTSVAAAVCETLAQYDPALNELRAASRRPQARFNFSYDSDETWRTAQPHLLLLKRIARLLALRASAQLALRNAPAAADDIQLIIALAESIRDEPFQSSQWARYTMLVNARQIIWEGLADRRWSAAQLETFQLRLQELSIVANLQRPLRFEQAAINDLFVALHRNPAMVKPWRFGPGLGKSMIPYFLWLMPSGWMYQEQAAYHHAFEDKLLSALDIESGRIPPGIFHNLTVVNSAFWNHHLLADAWLHSVESLLTGAALAQTGKDQALLACALERHRLANGQFPESLAALSPQFIPTVPADVITGQPMKYRRIEGDRFQLYSVGWNEKDDGGKAVMNKDGKTPNPAEGDWVWPQYPDE
jgi:hypothetical protein